MKIDFHCHVGKDISGESFSFKDLKKEMKKWEVDKAVVFPFNSENLIDDSLMILEESKKRDWIIPFLRFDPKKIKKDLFLDLLDKGFFGVKLHPSSQKFRFNKKKFFWIYEICEKRGIPILFHTSVSSEFANPFFAIDLAKKFPNLKIILAHFLTKDFERLKELSKYKNVYFDLSIASGTHKRKSAFEKYKMKNLLFASDAPYDSMGVSILKIEEANFSKKEKDLIFYKNALKILGNK